ncbi:MAG: hypothetical protein M1826_005299 [Phylliscum demangeonii]|nr:MAG: hypothetical protein M1826_005299 [Phylliscum demangeonii]
MKYSIAMLSLAAAVAQAQFPALPQCSLTCLAVLAGDGCTLTDFACHCKKPNLAAQITPCIEKACSASDASDTVATLTKTCADAGVPLPGTGASSAAAPAAAAPASSSAAAAPASSSAAATDAAAASSAPAAAASSAAPATSAAAAAAPSPAATSVGTPVSSLSYVVTSTPAADASSTMAGAAGAVAPASASGSSSVCTSSCSYVMTSTPSAGAAAPTGATRSNGTSASPVPTYAGAASHLAASAVAGVVALAVAAFFAL